MGASKACSPEAVKVAGSLSVHSALPGSPLLSAFSVAVSSAPAVDVSPIVWNVAPMEPSV